MSTPRASAERRALYTGAEVRFGVRRVIDFWAWVKRYWSVVVRGVAGGC